MWKTFFKCAILIGVLLSWSTTTGLSDKRLCADPQCQTIIAYGVAKLNYQRRDEGMVSLQINSQIRIKSKSAGSDTSLWGVEVNGREGYVPKEFIRETKIVVKEKDLFEVPVVVKDAAPIKTNEPLNTVLKASESNEDVSKIDIVTTTTLPLENVVSTDNLSLKTNSQEEHKDGVMSEQAKVTKRMQFIEGTKIPMLDDLPTMGGNDNDIDIDDDDDEYEDNDENDDEDDDDDDEGFLEKELKSKRELSNKESSSNSPKKEMKDNENSRNFETKIFEKSEVLSAEAELPENNNDHLKQDLTLSKNISDSISGNSGNSGEPITEHTNEVIDKNIKESNDKDLNSVENLKTESVSDADKLLFTKNITDNGHQQQVEGENLKDNKIDTANSLPENKFVDNQKPETIKGSEQTASESNELNSSNSQIVDNENKESIKSLESEPSKQNSFNEKHSNEQLEVNQDINVVKGEAEKQVPTSNVVTNVEDGPHIPAEESSKLKESNVASNVVTIPNLAEVVSNSKESVIMSDVGDISKSTEETPILNDSNVVPVEGINPISTEENGKLNEPNIVRNDDNSKESNIVPDLVGVPTSAEEKQKLKDSTEVPNDSVPSHSSEITPNLTESNEVPDVGDISKPPEVNEMLKQSNGIQNEGVISNSTEENLNVQDSNPVVLNQSTESLSKSEPPLFIMNNYVSTNLNEENIKVAEKENQIDTNTITTESAINSVQDKSQEELSIGETTTVTNTQTYIPRDFTESGNYYPNVDLPIDETTLTPLMNEYTHPVTVDETTPTPFVNEYTHPTPMQHDHLHNFENSVSQEESQHVAQQPNEVDQRPEYNTINVNTVDPSAEHKVTEENVAWENHDTNVDPIALPTQSLPPAGDSIKEKGLFSTIIETVNSFIPSNNKKDNSDPVQDMELQRILFPNKLSPPAQVNQYSEGYCEKSSSHDCPSKEDHPNQYYTSSGNDCKCKNYDVTVDNFVDVLLSKTIELTDLLACLGIAAASALLFLFGYYCFYSSNKEGVLLSRLNMLERSLLATHKENAILKHDLVTTRNKLSCIEDNSFGSNDMVVSLKQELEEELIERERLKEQISHLEKELENAAEAGLELNKIVSELLNNQTGDESIISSVEELQRQLNEQQNTILEINANLAEKSRENSELQLMIAEQNARLGGEIASLQQDNDELDAEKSNLQTRIEEMKVEFEEDITRALEGKNFEIKRLQNEIVELNTKHEDERTKRQTSQAKIEALEECLKSLKKDPSVNVKQIIDVANVRAELLDMQKKLSTVKEKLDVEMDARRSAEEKLNSLLVEGEKFKQDYHQSEKDKLEAQTRLEVLSNYFKEKETQLQKELSLKEAMWLKQQGEAVSTVDRLTTMQDEIQSLKSQNDSLRAEIEAQLAAHKAHTGTLENRAHETWLALRQAERRFEESRTEATALRRKLTALVGGTGASDSTRGIIDGKVGGDLNNAPSPIPLHMEPPGSPLLGRMPPPPFLPPPFIAPPPFLGMPPPFGPAGEMRPPPLGRMMSPPPPPGNGGSGAMHSSRMRSGGRYTPPEHAHYDDYVYDDDDDEEDDDEEETDIQNHHHRRRRRDSNGSWRRNSYSPPPRTYRSHSPTDSRYNYNASERDLISTYDTETDFSPPPSPHERSSGGGGVGSNRGVYGGNSNSKPYSPQPTASSPVNESSNDRKKKKRQAFSSDSDKSRYSGQR